MNSELRPLLCTDNLLVGCFSGRFDRPHLGHLIQMMRLGQRFKKVIIPILDYPEQKYSPSYRKQVIDAGLKYATGTYETIISTAHFAHAPEHRIKEFKFDVYISQNTDCLKHIEEMGYRVEYVDRAFDYSASDEFRRPAALPAR
jgi:nicotinamide mononucleotide adenylyltransferase